MSKSAKAAAPGESSAPETPSLESALERLDSLVQEMESSQLPLEALILRYEEGVRLLQACQEKLSAAEQKIHVITRQFRGKLALEEFVPETDEK